MSWWTSFSRTLRPLIRNWLSPERIDRRVTVTSANSIGSQPVLLSNVTVTSAKPPGARPLPPAKMTSSVFLLRRSEWLCSPRTQRTPSEMFDLPLPFGPMTAVIPGSNRKVVRLAKLLNPCSSRRVSLGSALESEVIAGRTRQGSAGRRVERRWYHPLSLGHNAQRQAPTAARRSAQRLHLRFAGIRGHLIARCPVMVQRAACSLAAPPTGSIRS